MPIPPIVILGMHRSGTSLLTRCLEALGLFTGWKKEINAEALFFLELNEWVFQQAGASWDNPHNLKFADSYFADHISYYLHRLQRSSRRIRFLGPMRALRYKALSQLNFPWGWKDPRNTFTVDYWDRVFPNLKILHIHRNPIDVAASLKFREEQTRKNYSHSKEELKRALSLNRLHLTGSLRVTYLEEGIKLWEEYIERALSLNKNFAGRILHICYEDFLVRPTSFLNEICRFTELKPDETRLEQAAQGANPERRFAFSKDRELFGAYESIKHSAIMKQLGYHEIPPAF